MTVPKSLQISNQVHCVCKLQMSIGESPYWHPKTKQLYWVDAIPGCIYQIDPETRALRSWSMPEEVGCLAACEGGGLVVALRKGFYQFDLNTAKTTSLFKVPDEPATNRFNDGKTDRQGRFWCGSLDEADKSPTGSLYRLDHRLRCERLVEGIICSNALCWSPDGSIMYFGDSTRRTVWAWDFDTSTGAISNRREFVVIPSRDGVPDGATVDSEGYVWIAHWGGWRVVRYDPKGRIERSLLLPVSQPTCPAFGGRDMTTLYITSAAFGLNNDALDQEPLAGSVFAAEVGITGIAETPFRLNRS